MIWVRKKTRNKMIEILDISGHADFAEEGRDVVCAAASLTGTGLLNALDIMAPEKCTLIKEENHIRIEVLENNDVIQNILNVGLIQFKTLNESFPKYVRIRKMEENA